MKDSVTRFNFDDAFKALDEIEIPVAEKGIRANRVDLKESMKKVDKFELLFEDFYDVNNADDMNTVSEEREAEVAKAKLARIEKIVDLDAETEDDILPSYVGKTIIQCPQCMMLFYKNAEDIVRDEENPDLVNVNEVCQHCGNESGYDVIGKVAEETEAAPGDELGTDEFSAEVGDGENDIAIDDGSETTEEAPAEEGGEVDELSAEADLDSIDLDAEEEPAEEESTEEVEESLKLTEKFKGHVENKEELKNELLRKIPESELWDDLGKKDELHCTLPGNNINIIKSKVESVLADSVLSAKVEVTKADMAEDDWIYVAITGIKEDTNAMQSFESLNNSEALKDAKEKSELKAEHESEKLTLNEDTELNKQLDLYNDFIKYLQKMVEQDEEALERAKKQDNKEVIAAIQKRLDNSKAELEAALPETVKDEADTEELPDATEAGMEDATDNTTEEVVEEEVVEEKKTTESLHEGKYGRLEAPSKDLSFLANEFDEALAATNDLSYDIEIKDGYIISVVSFDIKQVDDIAKKCFKKHDIVPVITEVSEFVHDYKLAPQDKVAEPAQESINTETQKKAEGLTESITNPSEADINKLFSSEEFNKPVSEEEVENFFENITEETDTDILVEAGGPIDRDRLLTVAKAGNYPVLVTMPFLNPKDIKAANVATDKTIAQCPVTNKDYIKYYPLAIDKNTDKKADKENFKQAQVDAKKLGKTKLTIKNYKMADGTPKVVDNASIQQVNFYLAREESVTPKELLAASTSVQNGNKVLYIGTYNAYSGTLDLSPLEQLKKSVKGMSFATVEDEEEETPVEVAEKSAEVTSDEDTTPVEVETSDEKPADSDAEKPADAAASDDKDSDASGSTTIGEVINKLAESGVELYLTIIRNGTDNKGQYTNNFTKIVKDLDITTLQTKAKDLSNNGMGNDYSIIVVKKSKADKLGSIITFNDLDKITLFRYNNGTETANFSKVVTAKEDLEKLTEEFDFSVEDIDEESFNEKLTESLTKVYENVKSFEMTDCISQNTQLIIEGLVTFNSGKTRTTSYTFDLSGINESKTAVIKGTNTELFESCTIELDTNIINETLYADKLNYKYTIQGNLVEGFIKNK